VNLTVALDRYEKWRVGTKHFSYQTWRGEKPGLRRFVTACATNGVHDVEALTSDVVDAWWDSLDLADSTLVTRLAQLRAFLAYCEGRGWLRDDPTAMVRAPRSMPAERERLDAGELLSLLEVAPHARDRILLALAMNLALRGGEITRLRVRDVDLPAGYIHVAVDKTRETDEMPISADLHDELVRWFGTYMPSSRQDYLVPSVYHGPSGLVFRPEKPVGKPYKVVSDALAQVGWVSTKQEGVHTIRRSVARLYFDKAEEEETFDSALLATMTLLHHSRPETTLKYVGRDRARSARDAILKGQPFLTRMSPKTALRAVK
jgi:integrase